MDFHAMLRWSNGILTMDNTVVGTAHKGAGLDADWFAYGCLSDWEDTPLGSHKTEADAKRAVEKWVEDAL
jgi:hypothetical protein